MRLDMGIRANALMDTRAAIVTEFKHAEERFNSLRKYAL